MKDIWILSSLSLLIHLFHNQDGFRQEIFCLLRKCTINKTSIQAFDNRMTSIYDKELKLMLLHRNQQKKKFN